VGDILGLDSLFAQMITALGLAMLIGNGLAWWKNRRGQRPRGVEGEFRGGRVAFLAGVGLILAVWGLASILTRGTTG